MEQYPDRPLDPAERAALWRISAPHIAGYDLWPTIQAQVAIARQGKLAAAVVRGELQRGEATGLYAALVTQYRSWRWN